MFGSRRRRRKREEERQAAGSRRRSRRRRRGPLASLFYWGAVTALWGVIAVFGAGLYVLVSLSDSSGFTLPERAPGITVLDATGAVLARRGAFHGDTVRIDELPPHLLQAVIATEDERFYNHFGVDPLALVRAAIANVRAGRIVQGGSTITQQLAKNLFLKPERTFERKMQEAMLALWLEGTYSKDEILQLYLNRVYFGAGAYGVDAAAQRYFGKSARELTLTESALLAAVLKAPSRYSPSSHPERARERAQHVLDRMIEAGYITDIEGKIAEDAPVAVASGRASGLRQYAVDWVSGLIPGYVGETRGEVVVETTIEPDLQVLAEDSLARIMNERGAERNAGQAALVTLAPDGAVKAMVGGRSYAKSQFNRAVKARRQPGSAFKPVVYVAAMESGLTPETVVDDEPVSIDGWQPKNYSDRYVGPVTLREGLARSINTVAAKLAAYVGPEQVVQTAHRLGIASELHSNPSIALGTAEVSLLELASAYVPLSNGGYGALPYVIRRITTGDGQVLYERHGSGPGRVLDEATVAQMNDMLSAVMEYGTGRNARIADHPAAGKTGTSQDFRDAWFVGYTAHLTTGVWVGNDDSEPMKRVTGSGLPSQIWRDFMKDAHYGLQVAELPGARMPERGYGLAGFFRALGLSFGGYDRDELDGFGRRRQAWRGLFGARREEGPDRRWYEQGEPEEDYELRRRPRQQSDTFNRNVLER